MGRGGESYIVDVENIRHSFEMRPLDGKVSLLLLQC